MEEYKKLEVCELQSVDQGMKNYIIKGQPKIVQGLTILIINRNGL